MAKGMIEDREETKSLWYKPAVVLVSDGEPNDSWQEPQRQFIQEGRSSKCQRISVAIGNDADEGMLKSFASNSEFFFKADDASRIATAFEKVTMSVMKDAVSQHSGIKTNSPKERTSIRRSVSRRARSSYDDENDMYNG